MKLLHKVFRGNRVNAVVPDERIAQPQVLCTIITKLLLLLDWTTTTTTTGLDHSLTNPTILPVFLLIIFLVTEHVQVAKIATLIPGINISGAWRMAYSGCA